MKRSQLLEFSDYEKLYNSDTWISEAKFGFDYLSSTIDFEKRNLNILEVGCGSGILLSLLKQAYPKNQYFGLEPFGPGFSTLKSFRTVDTRIGISIENISYEDFSTNEKFDLIYCVNVFEHLVDWRDFLVWSSTKLKAGGSLFILCPNYNFPYESHFKIPFVFSKDLTFRLFSRRIHSFENTAEAKGLWSSLNFVKKADVFKFFSSMREFDQFCLIDDLSIIDVICKRAINDPVFSSRQKLMASIVKILIKTSVYSLVKHFPRWLPYMALKLSRVDGTPDSR